MTRKGESDVSCADISNLLIRTDDPLTPGNYKPVSTRVDASIK